MKEFIQTLKQVYLVSWYDTLVYVGCTVGGGIFGSILMVILMAADAHNGGAMEYIQLGAMLALTIGVAVFFFASVFSFTNEFNLAISMGKTRKAFVPAKYLMLVLNLLVMQAVGIAVGLGEKLLYQILYPGAVNALSLIEIFRQPEVFLGIAFGGAMLLLLLGALVMRFAAKAFWVIWGIWMVGAASLSKIVSAISHAPENSLWARLGQAIMDWKSQISDFGIMMIVLVGTVIGLAGTYALLRRQRVIG